MLATQLSCFPSAHVHTLSRRSTYILLATEMGPPAPMRRPERPPSDDYFVAGSGRGLRGHRRYHWGDKASPVVYLTFWVVWYRPYWWFVCSSWRVASCKSIPTRRVHWIHQVLFACIAAASQNLCLATLEDRRHHFHSCFVFRSCCCCCYCGSRSCARCT